ncbi:MULTISPECIES: CCA tRNA nucleotidyltransferase [Sulfurovum]|uniref:CCA tRNA nucleotidyltransferase n=1 Tax=Sulfurovum xiamenensis TaxID=3019066 RepID=A0ABT7QNR4_9BACT|nr:MULTISPECIES: CCA tRNA nucleotidyltransferase [Sulfurovum]EIF50792.1 polynucleotide adenylyltransferase [Sulfurovum sp. AR]MDM5262722.1 CCA tRNA nucleotidyltransferase [Sulfurovum xiamenensis]
MPTIKSFPNFFSQTDPDILQNIKTVTEYLTQKYHAKCYIVGGAVRDRILGDECKDYDIECFGISIDDFETAMEHLGAQGVGKSFFVYKYHDLDISLPRTEKKIAKGHRGFEVSLALEEKEASKRRDFTINALMYDIQNEQILDFWDGLGDLEHKVIRVVDEDTFVEDSLRVLRAMQFAARFGFKVDEESCRLCQSISLDDLPKERIFKEFEKMFRGRYLHYGLYYLLALGIAKQLFDEHMERKTFIALSRVLQKSQKNFVEKLRPYYFLFICKAYFSLDITELLERLGAPTVYYKKVAASPSPTEISIPFIAHLSLREGIREYVGNYHMDVIAMAKKLDVWDKPFDRGVTPTELLEEGFSGKALGDELERRTEEKIMSLKEK